MVELFKYMIMVLLMIVRIAKRFICLIEEIQKESVIEDSQNKTRK